MEFRTKDDLRRFAKTLSKKMELMDEPLLARELSNWCEEFFLTSSEFFDELSSALERIKKLKTIDRMTKRQVEECLYSINHYFCKRIQI